MRRLAILALTLTATPALADEMTGEILAYDRLANLIVMRDRTIYELPGELAVPADLQSGDRVRIDFAPGGEDGFGEIRSVERVEE